MKKIIISGVCVAVFGTTFFANNSMAETSGSITNQEIQAASTQTSKFIDVPDWSWAYNEINYMVDHNIMLGYHNGYFGALEEITREELAAFLYRTVKIPDRDMSQPLPFNDINDSMFKKEIAAGLKSGIFFPASDGRFNPNRTVTRAELAQTFKNAFGLNKKFDYQFNDTQGHWANEAIETLYSNGITGGVGNNNFNPDGTVTREQLAVFLYRAIPVSIKELRDNAK
ncbi:MULTISPECIES: S-layer homology domain-containing protein [Bacillus cereus group]|uniref:S-layer protein n=3 Tax=Bacillus cereus group TaxID=86661 RepID=A0A243CWY9_BACTU|nr:MULTISPECIES: S-layer homology domain-containing protein [Bacillus cereus group]EEM56631.1 S-layer y domain ribonuclease [Bacillus thuringiensis serovar monterrey BGSC 4AJ1]EEM86564.1 S-layer y domain ribonuclease [Bacillus thuringiensis serovar pulsiensis BGSC 4CC1]MEB9674179.1 S-layer homology domain-containing protein [Bacillus anthracis]OTW51117.1 S-layer protein [Bacillus thuringiensis serovar mexicanensis]OTW98979.1 S-layer protein [Bacillus thuringiensis serovar monterrey]